MKQEEKEWWKAIWKLTKAVLRIGFVTCSVVFAYTGVGLHKLGEWMGNMSDKLS